MDEVIDIEILRAATEIKHNDDPGATPEGREQLESPIGFKI